MSRLSDALVAHWKMNDNAANATVTDDTGDHNGTYKDAGGNLNTDTGATTGRINGALDFDGTDEYVEIADHADFTPALTPFSISVWVYMHDATNFSVVSKGVFNTDGEWSLDADGADRLRILFYDESVANCYIGQRINGGVTGYENQWLHIVATYDGGADKDGIKLYLNGVDSGSGIFAGVFVAVEDLAGPVYIGRYDADYGDGLIDNLMIFNIELTHEEIIRLYNNGLGTENLAEIESVWGTPRRSNAFPLSSRSRYEF